LHLLTRHDRLPVKQIADCRLPIADCRLPIADFPDSGLRQIANRKSQIANRKSLWLILGGLLGLAGLGGTVRAAAPESVSITAEVDRSVVSLGEEILYTLTVEWSAGQVRDPQLKPPDLEDFQVTGPDTQREAGAGLPASPDARRITQQFTYHLRPESPGVFTIGPAALDYHAARSNEPRTAASAPVTVTVVDLIGGEDIRDIKGLLPLLVSYRRLWWAAGGALAVTALLTAAAVLYWRRAAIRHATRRETPEPPRPPAHELARRELAALRAANLPAQGQIDEYHVRLSEIVRRYLAGRYGLPALASTTAEIRAQLGEAQLPESLIQRADEILRRCDWEKFGAYRPSLAEMDAVFAAAERFVDDTQP
jgi:hypothetical protein